MRPIVDSMILYRSSLCWALQNLFWKWATSAPPGHLRVRSVVYGERITRIRPCKHAQRDLACPWQPCQIKPEYFITTGLDSRNGVVNRERICH